MQGSGQVEAAAALSNTQCDCDALMGKMIQSRNKEPNKKQGSRRAALHRTNSL
jgi:hypothetical protein